MRLLATRLNAIASSIIKRSFTPLSLFSLGEQGVWYDPSDWSTLFQDSFGTTPVTAVEQPVGLMLDKHTNSVYQQATGITWAKTAGDGVLTVSGTQVTVTGATTTTQITRTAGSIPLQAGRARMVIQANYSTATGVRAWLRGVPGALSNGVTVTRGESLSNSHLERLDVSTGTVTFNISYLEFWRGNHATQPTSTSRPVLSARVNNLLGTTALATQSITTLATVHTFRFEGDGSVVLSGSAIGTYAAGTHSITCTAGTLMLTVTGSVLLADFREYSANSIAPAYQRITTATDYDTSGFPMYLRADGIDDGMVTGSVDFTATDKMAVIAGVRKLSYAARGTILELSSVFTNPGTFAMEASFDAGATYRFVVTANTAGATYSDYGIAAPKTSVLSLSANNSTPTFSIKVDGVQKPSLPTQSTGNYGNYPLYLFRRGGTSLPFNGNFYGLIIRGVQTSDSDIAKVEKWMASKTGVAI